MQIKYKINSIHFTLILFFKKPFKYGQAKQIKAIWHMHWF